MKPKLDANFINPFISGTVSTLKIQCSVDAHAGTAFLKSKTSPKLKTDIAGLIGITSEAFRGNIAICFPEKTFLGIMSQMLGEEFTEINNEVEDGAGELMNIIFGTAKKVLNEQGYTIRKALPTVIRGMGLEISNLSMVPVLILPFESTVGVFQIEITLDMD